ncbi:MAG: head GIN domain-containing protein [Pseudomonadota bacterium]
MRKTVLFALAAMSASAAAPSALAFWHDEEDDDEIVRSIDVTDFDRIEVSGVFDLDVKIGGAYRLEIEGKPKALDRVKAVVKNGELRLEYHEKRRGWGHGHNHGGVDARLTMPALVRLDVSGVVDADIEGVNSDQFEINLSGVGDLDFEGVCGRLDANVSGVGDLDAGDLECRDVDISVSGVGDARVFASKSVDADASGMGDITVLGDPEQVRETSGLFSEVTVR